MRTERHTIYGFADTLARLGLLKGSPYSAKRFGKIMLQLCRDRNNDIEEEYGNQWGT